MLSKEQKLLRRTGIGGSDAAALAGLSPWRSKLDVFLEKTSQEEIGEESMTERQFFGHMLEDTVARAWVHFMRQEGHLVEVEVISQTLRSAEHPFALANIDRAVRWLDGRPAKEGLECKTADTFTAHLWGDAESDEVPDYYLIQCMHYLMVTGWERWHLAVLIGGNRFRKYVIERDEELIAYLATIERQFWTEHVEPRLAPAPTNLEDIKRLYRRDNGQPIIADADTARRVAELKALRAQKREIADREEELEFAIKQFMGEHAQLLLDADGKKLLTWKNNRDGERFDEKRFAEDHPGLYEQYMKPVPGARVFRLA